MTWDFEENKFRTPLEEDDYEASGEEDDGEEVVEVVEVEITDEDVDDFNRQAEG